MDNSVYINYIYWHDEVNTENGSFSFNSYEEAKEWLEKIKNEINSACKKVEITADRVAFYNTNDDEACIPSLNDYMVAADVWIDPTTAPLWKEEIVEYIRNLS